jgi:putative oxidoreductase
MEYGILILRLAVGLVVAAHGTQKLFGCFAGPGLDGAGRFMESVGFLPGRRTALLAGLTETSAGLALALGLATPAAAAALAAAMTVAAGVTSRNGFFVQKGGSEYTVVLTCAALAVAFTGPGTLSVDALVGLARSGPRWGLSAMAAGLAGGALQLARRRAPA